MTDGHSRGNWIPCKHTEETDAMLWFNQRLLIQMECFSLAQVSAISSTKKVLYMLLNSNTLDTFWCTEWFLCIRWTEGNLMAFQRHRNRMQPTGLKRNRNHLQLEKLWETIFPDLCSNKHNKLNCKNMQDMFSENWSYRLESTLWSPLTVQRASVAVTR